jgi:hypothetical protein
LTKDCRISSVKIIGAGSQPAKKWVGWDSNPEPIP